LSNFYTIIKLLLNQIKQDIVIIFARRSPFFNLIFMRLIITTVFTFFSICSFAIDSLVNKVFWHFQTNYIYQYKPAFNVPYSGQNSLLPTQETQNSITSTLFLGVKLWKGGELYINPEVAGGSGLSGAYGMAASTNGETFRIGDPAPTLYLGRCYLKQTFAFNTPTDSAADAYNQVPAVYPTRSISFYLGKYSLGDLFDNNQYSTGPRMGFLNWCFMNNGAWDYAADLRGYTYAFTTILRLDNTSYKIALACLPKVANGIALNTDLGQEYSLNAEVTHKYKLHKKEGNVRLLGYYNDGHMGNYDQAISEATPGNSPSVISTRAYGRSKYGLGLNVDQQIDDIAGAFLRLGWNDGKNETWCFTEADRTLSGGFTFNGKNWKRKDDVVGLGVIVNALSDPHREYLADGGMGFQIGDGKLNYAFEKVTEVYYSLKPTENALWITADYQLALDPGYNKDRRGPVSVLSLRVHVEF